MVTKERKFKVFKDAVAIVYENEKPVAMILKNSGHDLFYSVREMHGDQVLDIIQSIVVENELEKSI